MHAKVHDIYLWISHNSLVKLFRKKIFGRSVVYYRNNELILISVPTNPFQHLFFNKKSERNRARSLQLAEKNGKRSTSKCVIRNSLHVSPFKSVASCAHMEWVWMTDLAEGLLRYTTYHNGVHADCFKLGVFGASTICCSMSCFHGRQRTIKRF